MLTARRLLRPLRRIPRFDFRKKLINPIRWLYYTTFKGYTDYVLGSDIRNGVYKVFLHWQGQRLYVAKIPKNDNKHGKAFVQRIRSAEGYAEFRQTIAGMCERKYLGRHVVEVTEIRKNGAHVTPFIAGYNLAEVLTGSVTLPRRARNDSSDRQMS
jgi:hypothetical protein